MSEEFEIADLKGFGRESIERGQGFTPMEPAAREIEEAQQEQRTAERIAQQMDLPAAPGTGVNEPLAVQYNKPNADGTRSNEKIDERLSVTPERAAEDLADWRRGQEDIQRALHDVEFSQEIDKLRSSEGVQAEAPPEPQPTQAQQPEQQPQYPGVDPEVQKALENPRVLAAINQQRMADLAQGQQAVAAAQQAIQDAAGMARAAILVRHPELQGLTNEQWPVAMNMLQQKDPAKFSEIKQEVEAAQTLLQVAAQQQAQQQRVQQQQQLAHAQAWATREDNAFEAEFAKEPPHRQEAIRAEARTMLRDYGLNDQEIAWAWSNDPVMRSRAGQLILRDAAAYRLQQKTAQTIRPTYTPVRVQKPGPAGTIARQGDEDLRGLSNKLTQTGSAKDAAALLAARRARAR